MNATREPNALPSGSALELRPGRPEDVALVLKLIHELAEYERLSHEVSATEEMLRESLFGKHPAAEVVLAFSRGEPAGLALFFQNFSTFLGLPGLYLEDLFIRPAFRRQGIGRALLQHLAGIAVARGYGRFEWSVLDWNTPAAEFYRSLGAQPMSDWTVFRLTGDGLKRLADL